MSDEPPDDVDRLLRLPLDQLSAEFESPCGTLREHDRTFATARESYRRVLADRERVVKAFTEHVLRVANPFAEDIIRHQRAMGDQPSCRVLALITPPPDGAGDPLNAAAGSSNAAHGLEAPRPLPSHPSPSTLGSYPTSSHQLASPLNLSSGVQVSADVARPSSWGVIPGAAEAVRDNSRECGQKRRSSSEMFGLVKRKPLGSDSESGPANDAATVGQGDITSAGGMLEGGVVTSRQTEPKSGATS